MKKSRFLLVLALAVFSLAGCNNKGHSHSYDFNNPVWNWESVLGGEGYTAKVTLACAGCDETTKGHYLTLDAIVSHATINPTCEDDGSITYTAIATYENKTFTDQKIDVIQELGHNFDTITVEGNYKKTYVALETFDSSSIVVKTICSREGCGKEIVLSENEYFIIYQSQGVDHLCAGDTKVIISANYAPFATYELSGLTVTKIPNSINGMENSYTTSCHQKPDLSGVTSLSGDLELTYYNDSSCTQEIELEDLSAGTYYIKATAGDTNYEEVSQIATLTVKHAFDQFIEDDNYLHSAATKFENASYYKSCTCGIASTLETDVFVAEETKLPDTVAKSAFVNYVSVNETVPAGYKSVSKNTASYGENNQGYSILADLDLSAIEDKVSFMILTKNGSICQKGWSGESLLEKDKWYSVEIVKNNDFTYSSTISDENGNIKIQYSNKQHIGQYQNEVKDSTVLPYYQWGEPAELYSTEVYGIRCSDETFNQLVSASSVPSYTLVDMISPKGYQTVTLSSKTYNDSDQGKAFLTDIALDNYQSLSFVFKTKNRRFCKSDWSSPISIDTWYTCTFERNSSGSYDCNITDINGATKFSYKNVTSFKDGLKYYNWDGSAPNLEWYSTEVRGVAL